MLVIILNYPEGSVHIEEVESEEDIWEMGFKESETEWMELDNVHNVSFALSEYLIQKDY